MAPPSSFIPGSRLQQQHNILLFIGLGLSHSEISRQSGCSRSLIWKIWCSLGWSGNIFEQIAERGWSFKISDELLAKFDALYFREVWSSSINLAAILSEPLSQETYSPEFMRLGRHWLGHHFDLGQHILMQSRISGASSRGGREAGTNSLEQVIALMSQVWTSLD
jgi:hypothetical protein